MAEETAAPAFDPVYVYEFKDPRYAELRGLWAYYESTQHDHCRNDWTGRPRLPGEGYTLGRFRVRGHPPEKNRVHHDDRRPNIIMGLVPRIVDRFAEMTCKQPVMVVRGDEDSTLALEAVFDAGEAWDALTEMETVAGICKSAAIVPSISDEGEPCHEVLRPYEVYVRAWKDRRRWIPSEVIHQVLVDVERTNPETQAVECVTMVRTRMWTETHVIHFADVPLAEWDRRKALEPDPGLEDAVLEHGWGRCPVIWHQNTRNTSGPDGLSDIRNAANLELSDQTDRTASHAVQATKANTSPTLVRSDRDITFINHPRVAKGHGNEIRTSEVGKAVYLETSGASVEMAWSGVDRLTLTILRNCNCVIWDVDMGMAARGTGESGEALARRGQSMRRACDRKRVTLRRTIRQLARMWLAALRERQISSEDAPEEGTIVLPPRCFKEMEPAPGEEGEEDDGDEQTELPEDEMQSAAQSMLGNKQDPSAILEWRDMDDTGRTYGPHRLGQGTSIDFRWPPYDELTPAQIQAYLQALGSATGKPLLSQQTGIELATVALGLPDAQQEKRRVLEERKLGVQHLVGMMGGAGEAAPDDAEAAGEDAAGDSGDAEEDDGEDTGKVAGETREPTPGGPPPPGGKTEAT